MIFAIGVVFFIVGKFILAMHVSDLAMGHVSNAAKTGFVFSASGSILILFSVLNLAWSYLP